jgi:hypothetical protein
MEHGVFVQYAQCPDESDGRHWIVFDKSTHVGRKVECLFCHAMKDVGEIREGWIGQTTADEGFTKTEPSKKWGNSAVK